MFERDAFQIVRVGKLPVDFYLLQDFAVADRTAGCLVDDPARAGAAVGESGTEQFRAGFHQHHASGRARTRDAVEFGGDASAVDGVSETVDAEVLHALERRIEAHVFPAHFQFLGNHLRQSGADMLAHLGLDDVHGGDAVGRDGEPDGRGKFRRGRGRCIAAGDEAGQTDAQETAAGNQCGAHQKFAARHTLYDGLIHDAHPPSSIARLAAQPRRCASTWRTGTNCRSCARRFLPRWGLG